MTLFSAPHATKVLGLALAFAASGMTTAQAGGDAGWSEPAIAGRTIPLRDRHHWRHREERDFRHATRHREHRGWRGGDFYGGAITAYRDPGNGTYFYIENDDAGAIVEAPRLGLTGPKVIHVVPGQSGCAWEMGVCVVRPSF